jgi:hypothetical protein
VLVSAEFTAEFALAQSRAHLTGRPFLDVLAEADLLLTPERKKQIVTQFMDFMIRTLEENETPEAVMRSWLGGKPGTPADMYFGMIQWLNDWKKVELE